MSGVFERNTTSGPPRWVVLISPMPVSACHRAWYRSASAAIGAVSGSSRVVARQNSSDIVSPVSVVVHTVYSTIRTRIGGPSFLRGGFSSLIQEPSASTSITGRVKLADIRHNRSASVAVKVRHSCQDGKLL